MYNKIINPLTGKKVSVKSKLGKKIIKNYLSLLGGATSSMVSRKNINIGIVSSSRDIFLNKRMVMSGFRDKNIEKFIMEHSGVIENKVNNETSMLLIKDKRCKSTKINNAIKLDINIMLLDDFKKKYNVNSSH